MTVLLVVVLVVATALAGTATAVALRLFLLGRLDAQLSAAGGRFAASLSAGTRGDVVPGQPVGTLGVRLVDGRVAEAAVVGPGGQSVTAALSPDDVRALAGLTPDGARLTVDLDRLHDYRLQAQAAADGSVQVTGLPEAEVDATMRRLIAVEVMLFVAVIAVAGCVVAVLVRRTLRPLRTVAETARHVAGLPLTSAAAPIEIPPPAQDSTSEVGDVATAFDQMLAHVRSALAARDVTEERLRQFVADASHEFRTPLATIRAHTDLLQEDFPATASDSLARIAGATARMTGLVEDLLLLARLDDGGRPRGSEADLSRIVVEVVTDAGAVAPGHRWRLDLPEEPVEVVGDEEDLRRVVSNLVGNAAQHTPAGTTVTVTLDATGEGAHLVVADDGPGIPRSDQTKVFDRFTRGDVARSSAQRSTGLGLAIARGVVVAHGGTIAVHSRPGDTRFAVTLPRVAAARVRSSAAPSPVASSSSPTAP